MTFLCTDYTKLASQDDRIKTAFKELTAAGMPKAKAQSVLAISANESGYLWAMPRPQDLFYKLPPCVQCRQIVGFEPNREGLVTMPGDPALLAWMQANKIVSGAGVPGPAITTDAKKFTNIGRWLEAVMNARDSRSLWNFSIGPTQMFMGNTGLANKAAAGKEPPGFPRTWEDIFSQYLNSNAGETVPSLAYLDLKNTTATKYPADAPGDRNNGVRWLQFQVGNPTTAGLYWDGGGPLHFQSYSKNLNHIINIT